MITENKDTAERFWFVAYVRMHHERKIADSLSQMGIENFVPVQTQMRKWSDRMKKVDVVLIPMVVFVHATEEERKQTFVLAALRFYLSVKGTYKVVKIPDEQMQRFKFMVDYSDEAISFNPDCFAEGDRIRVVKGPLTGLTGILVGKGGKSKIAVQLDLLGMATVDIPIGYVEKLNDTQI